MCCGVTVKPFGGCDLVGAQLGSNGVVEDFCCGAGQRRQAGFFQAAEICHEVFSEAFRSLGDFKSGEPVHVNRGGGATDGMGDIDVVVAVEVGVNSPLQRDLGSSEFFGFAGSFGDVIEGKQVGGAAQVE